MNLYDYHKDPKSLHKYKEFMEQEHTWELLKLPGDMGSSTFEHISSLPTTDKESGITILHFEDYSDDNWDADNYGIEYYQAQVTGSWAQVLKFIRIHFDGVGEIIKVK